MVGYNGDPNAPQRFPAVKVPLGRYKIPPKSLQEILPQQLWVLEAAFQAMEDAGAEVTGSFTDFGMRIQPLALRSNTAALPSS